MPERRCDSALSPGLLPDRPPGTSERGDSAGFAQAERAVGGLSCGRRQPGHRRARQLRSAAPRGAGPLGAVRAGEPERLTNLMAMLTLMRIERWNPRRDGPVTEASMRHKVETI